MQLLALVIFPPKIGRFHLVVNSRTCKQVFWLTDHPTLQTFPSGCIEPDSGLTLRSISVSEFRSRIQQRGLRWSLTTFPQLQAGSG